MITFVTNPLADAAGVILAACAVLGLAYFAAVLRRIPAVLRHRRERPTVILPPRKPLTDDDIKRYTTEWQKQQGGGRG